MMSNSNMPAMPVTAMEDVLSEDGSYCGEVEKTHPGLTKLEHFAGLAMQGLITLKGSDCQNADQTAMQCVRMAKALLAQLEKAE